jgi:hypothetical protein
MHTNGPDETDGREDYYNAALVCIVLICDTCQATLDPDEDLGPDVSFESDNYYVLLGDEAYRRGWLVNVSGDITRARCPKCAKNMGHDPTSK